MNDLTDKIAIVTGAAQGIGQATARLFLAAGAQVLLVDRDRQALDATLEALQAESRVQNPRAPADRVRLIAADVSQQADVAAYVAYALESFGRIDILFNNAGVVGPIAPLVDQRVEDLDTLYAVNVRGVFLGMKHVLPVMREQRSGSVINMSSIAGLKGSPGMSLYSASKHAVIGLTKTAALEHARDGIRVNSIHPAATDTQMMRAIEHGRNPGLEDQAKAFFNASIPLGRYAQTDDVARLALFLASDDSRFISGAQHRVDGGMAAI